ncbi:MAG TPA: UvrD-helicase domain-containing protein [Candidatus Woesebacteria bacterium]|nr:UvrD-helicase domain-containing protein [Candidatus Woesebacteria bacterium]
MNKNKLIIAAAGSGKTTYIIKKALEIKDKNVLITTYTEANSDEIRKKVIEERGYIPKNITIQTWFSFLLQHGVRPYQSIIHEGLNNIKIGFLLTEERSGKKVDASGNVIYGTNPKNGKKFPIFWGKDNIGHYFFTKNKKIYSDKTAEFIVDANTKMNGEIIHRIARIYPYIFVDEVQDLAGWELEILKLLFESNSNILLVGDPRQVTYLTHHSIKYQKYRDGKIQDFLNNECKKDSYEIDTTTLKNTHRSNKEICDFSSQLFPDYEKCEPCTCTKCRSDKKEFEGIYAVREQDVPAYSDQFSPVTLKWSGAIPPEWNFGKSKGLTFERVLIYPTKTGGKSMVSWLKNRTIDLSSETRSKFYVAITRARYSVGIVYNFKANETLESINNYIPNNG